MRVAFYGRRASVNIRKEGNRSLALQYLACLCALPAEARLVAVYYDFGIAGRPHPNPPDHLVVAGRHVRRDGGIAGLLTHAATTTRRFDHLILTDTSRLTRHAGEFLTTVGRLADLGIGLLLISRTNPLHAVPLNQTMTELLAHVHRAIGDLLLASATDASKTRLNTDQSRSAQ